MFTRGRVLLIDDNYMLSQGLAILFSAQRDLELVASLSTLEGADAHVRSNSIDVVLLDLGMPGGNAIELIRSLAKTCPNTRVVIYSGVVDCGLLKQTREAGAAGYLVKGDDGPAELLSRVREAIAGQEVFSRSVGQFLDHC